MSTLTLPLHELVDDVDNGQHHLEFEAPLSAQSPNFKPVSANSRPFSIDYLSLELERQLDLESLPNTPSHIAHHSVPSPMTAHPIPKHESLDPHVLAHIIMQLRQSLADMTKERDDLLNLVSSATTQEAEYKDALQHMTDKATGLEEELSEARNKMKDDEDAINMLRTKVEESRRGLMRLQTENRRQSQAPSALDLSRASLPAFGSPHSSKRASFTPLTGSMISGRPNNHKRVSSVSDSGIGFAEAMMLSPTQSVFIPEPSSSASTKASRRISGIFGRNGSPPQVETGPLHDPELELLKKELKSFKDELDEMRHELTEANEAKEASETCVKALREFIEENNTGTANQSSDSSKLPPLTAGEEADNKKNSGGGWARWGWKVDTTVKPSAGPPSASSNASSAATPVTAPLTGALPAAAGAAPLARKIGGFFASRGTSFSGTNFAPTAPQQHAPLQSNAASPRDSYHRDSMYSFSDASSVAEPVSPIGEGSVDVLVRDAASDLNSVGPSPNDLKSGMMEGEHTGRIVVG